MATTTYFEKDVIDSADNGSMHVDVGTSSFAGNGRQLYINIDGKHLIMPDEDAELFCKAVAEIAVYMRFNTK